MVSPFYGDSSPTTRVNVQSAVCPQNKVCSKKQTGTSSDETYEFGISVECPFYLLGNLNKISRGG